MKKRILIVDDVIDFTFMMKLTLELTGQYQCRAVNLSSQVFQVAREFKPDLVLLDCMMPGMDGGEVASKLQDDPQLKNIPFIFLTATVNEPDVPRTGTYKGLLFLPKETPLQHLVDIIDAKIAGRDVTAPPGADTVLIDDRKAKNSTP